MDKKSKIVVWIFTLTVVFLFSHEFYRIFGEHDYVIKAHIPCDPAQESCFSYVCPDGAESCDEETFARITKNIKGAVPCDQYSEDCADLSCSEGDPRCEIFYCTAENLEEDQQCVRTEKDLDVGAVPETGENATTSALEASEAPED